MKSTKPSVYGTLQMATFVPLSRYSSYTLKPGYDKAFAIIERQGIKYIRKGCIATSTEV